MRVNEAAFQQRIATYTARYGNNHPYSPVNHNSNYAVNYVVYGSGNAPGGGFLGWSPLGWAPPFAGGINNETIKI